jgi:sterol desaturase/sphingolipid hydroxylase (fatty acid hydroxylase superfamily)
MSATYPAGLGPHASMPLFYRWQPILVHNYEGHLFSYTVTAGLAFFIFYVICRRWLAHRKVQPAFPRFSDVQREIFYSLLSMAVFAAVGFLTLMLKRGGLAHIYNRIGDHGWIYFGFSVLALIFLHDTWFYWTHRAMHWKPLFRLAHRVHHQSHNPTPWAAFAFHPLEALIESLMFPILVLVMPIHPLAAGWWLTYMIVMNVLGHLGYEVLPAGFARHRFFRWHNTSVHHNMHHNRVHCNYGLYFNIWDRLMGTNHPDYENQYDRVTRREFAIK